ncbi:MAG: hypothetical protein U5L10_04080 [Candidatus Moranbacteria bacterium]|nr:hypothetical protein [Candidatus Moranbacteria bacterium]
MSQRNFAQKLRKLFNHLNFLFFVLFFVLRKSGKSRFFLFASRVRIAGKRLVDYKTGLFLKKKKMI